MSRGAKRDTAITKLLLDNGLLLDKRSFVSLGAEPHLYLKGPDVSAQRQRLLKKWDGRCGLCRGTIYVYDGYSEPEMHHRQGGLVGRHDDLSNLGFLCHDCHRKQHVQVRWTKQEEAQP